MLVDDAYELTLSMIRLLEELGIKVTKKPTKSRIIPAKVEKYSGVNYIKPDKWLHVTFYPKNQNEARIIREQVRALGNLGIHFDNGGSQDLRDWELDWSFTVSDPDLEREAMQDEVEDMLTEKENGKK